MHEDETYNITAALTKMTIAQPGAIPVTIPGTNYSKNSLSATTT
jgi:hypothetical protein